MGVSGYKQLYMPDYYCATKMGFVAEHRYVAEQKIGRHLKPGEVIHHIDRDRLNNDPDNLIVFHSKADHSRYHRGGTLEKTDDGSYISKFLKPQRACLYCGKIFEITSSCPDKKYCCHACAALAQRKYERPTKKQLKRLLVEFSITQISRLFDVSYEVIRDWCKAYGLPYKTKELDKLRAKERVKETRRQQNQELKRRQKESDKFQKEIYG